MDNGVLRFFKIFGLFGMVAVDLSHAAKDNKITIKEGIYILEKVCKRLGIDFDKKGITFK